jgi:hypothetical protein
MKFLVARHPIAHTHSLSVTDLCFVIDQIAWGAFQGETRPRSAGSAACFFFNCDRVN